MLKNLGKALDGGVRDAAKALNKGKEGAYHVAAHIERDLKNPNTTLGTLSRCIDDLITDTAKLHERIKRDGGYTEKVDRAAEQYLNAIDRFADRLAAAANRHYVRVAEKLHQTFYTNGEVDSAKVEAFVKEQKNAVKEYGHKFVEKLKGAATTAHQSIVEDYRRNIPSAQELTTKYAGIGTAYSGILARSDYEGCLAFYGYAERTLPAGKMYRNHILADIKATASENLDELKSYYTSLENDKSAAYKLQLVDNYLGRSKKKKSK